MAKKKTTTVKTRRSRRTRSSRGRTVLTVQAWYRRRQLRVASTQEQ